MYVSNRISIRNTCPRGAGIGRQLRCPKRLGARVFEMAWFGVPDVRVEEERNYDDFKLRMPQVDSGCAAAVGGVACTRKRDGPSRHGLDLGHCPRSKRRRNTQG